MLLPLVEHHDLVAGVLLEEEQLAGIGGGIMGQGLHAVDELQQHPYSQDDPLVRGAIGVQAQVIAVPHIGDALVPLHAVQQPFRRGRRLVPQQPHHLGLRQWPVLGKPFDYVLFVCQKHGVTPLCVFFLECVFPAGTRINWCPGPEMPGYAHNDSKTQNHGTAFSTAISCTHLLHKGSNYQHPAVPALVIAGGEGQIALCLGDGSHAGFFQQRGAEILHLGGTAQISVGVHQ